MERLVIYLCGLWFWVTRTHRTTRYAEVADFLDSAKLYLASDFNDRASTRDRGSLLPHQAEALRILEQQRSFASKTSRRFQSLSECVQLVAEELLEPPRAA